MNNNQIRKNLNPLLIFVGNWKVEGVNFASGPNSSDVKVTGAQKVKLMEGGIFLKADWKYKSSGNGHIGISIIGTDNDSKVPKMHNFDNLGFYREYELNSTENTWSIKGKIERATLEFDKKGKSYMEKWKIKKNGKWHPLYERKATKI